MNICVYGASSNDIDKMYIEAGELLGEAMAKSGPTLVFGGGQTGLMGAVVRGIYRCGGKSIGIAPTFFDLPGVLFEECTEFIFTETMRERKDLMSYSSKNPYGNKTSNLYYHIFEMFKSFT